MFILTIGWVSGTSCGEEAPAPYTAADSSGVQIVMNRVKQWAAEDAWSIPPEPILSIGTNEGDSVYQLYGASSATRLTDGTIIVGNAGSRQIRFFGPDGAHLRSVGRQGGGPGEFERLSAVTAFSQDSLLVFDWQLKRVSLFTENGDFVNSFRLADVEFRGVVRLEGRFDDGTLLVRNNPAFPEQAPPGLQRISRPHILINTEGDSIGAFVLSGTDRFYRALEGGGMMYGTPLASRDTYTAVAGRSLFVGDNEAYAIDEYDRDGDLVRSIRRAVEPIRMTDEIYWEAVEKVVQRMSEDRRAQTRSNYEDQLRVPFLPFYSAIEVDAEGYLWVKEFASASRPNVEWSVFDPAGKWLGQVAMPHSFTVYEIGADYVLGRWRDDLDVEHIRMYRLLKG